MRTESVPTPSPAHPSFPRKRESICCRSASCCRSIQKPITWIPAFAGMTTLPVRVRGNDDYLEGRRYPYDPLRTVLIECVRQVSRDVIRGATFDLVALQHVDDLAVLEQPYLR